MDWYKTAIIYGIDVKSFQDSNNDGIGDFPGLTQRIPYLVQLGITCIWLLPFYKSPGHDNGYDVQDHFSIDPRLGTLDDFIHFVHKAGEAGIRVIIDLVMNHTSDQHPWFQAARHDSTSKFHDYYVWANQPNPEVTDENAFPGECDTVWSYDELANKYYYHKFYAFQPDLNSSNPQVREEMFKFMDFWLSFGVAGFRIDSIQLMVHHKGDHDPLGVNPADLVREFRAFVSERNPDAVLFGEADVKSEEFLNFIGPDRLHLAFNFLFSSHLSLALATECADPLHRGTSELPVIPGSVHWLNFLRNLDELNISHLRVPEREKSL